MIGKVLELKVEQHLLIYETSLLFNVCLKQVPFFSDNTLSFGRNNKL